MSEGQNISWEIIGMGLDFKGVQNNQFLTSYSRKSFIEL